MVTQGDYGSRVHLRTTYLFTSLRESVMTVNSYRLMFAVWKVARDHFGTTLHPQVLAIMYHMDAINRASRPGHKCKSVQP